MQSTVESPPTVTLRQPGANAPAPDPAAGAPSGAAPAPDEQVRDLTARLAQAESELAKAKAAADTSDLRRRIERALADTGAIDVDVACVLAENTIATTKSTIADTVAALKKSKPFLFRAPSTGPRTSAMSAVATPGAPETLADLAQGARAGDRGSLLRYLRAKRSR